MISTVEELESRLQQAIASAFGVEGADPGVTPASNPQFGDYQANAPLSLARSLGKPPREVAEALLTAVDLGDLATAEVAGPGFINMKVKPEYLEAQLNAIKDDVRLGVPLAAQLVKTVVDFSGPNIAKEMHVGHLRSTIIGDSLARLLEFYGHDVLRLNHLGDWGTQFGMLIAFLKEKYPQALTEADAYAMGDIVSFYKQAKAHFDEDEAFQTTAREEVVRLQAGDEDSLRAWRLLTAQSTRAFREIYQLLDVEITERGESFYNYRLSSIAAELEEKGVAVESEGALCVFIEGDEVPLIIRKSDGGYNYGTTDLAALRQRLDEEHGRRLIYVVDAGQSGHFVQVFAAARRAGWVSEDAELTHVPFGVVQGEDGKKFKTRSGDSVRLRDLLDEAIERVRADFTARLAQENRQESPAYIDEVSQTIGLGAVKYADLSQNRLSNYVFSYEKMLALHGNTAPYLIYAYVRVQGIARKQEGVGGAVLLKEAAELDLARQLLRFDEALDKVARDYEPNHLCAYLFELSQKFNSFYEACPILSAEASVKASRLTLADLTAKTLKLGLGLLGIKTVERL